MNNVISIYIVETHQSSCVPAPSAVGFVAIEAVVGGSVVAVAAGRAQSDSACVGKSTWPRKNTPWTRNSCWQYLRLVHLLVLQLLLEKSQSYSM